MFQKFYHNTLRNYVIFFGYLFRNIMFDRLNDEGEVVQTIRVPLSYAPKEKMLARVNQDPGIDRQTAITLPRISFEYVSMRYDGDRKLPSTGRVAVKHPVNTSRFLYQYNPVPYDIEFKLYVYVKNAEDGTKIVEQILPYFSPEWNASLQIIPEINEVRDIALVLNSCEPQDLYDQSFLERRVIVWTLSFTLKGYFYGPIKHRPIIKFVKTDFHFGSKEDPGEVVDIINVQPGLTANGEPTSDVNLSIDPLLIDVDDDFGYVIEKSGLVIVEEEN